MKRDRSVAEVVGHLDGGSVVVRAHLEAPERAERT
jgi:hypothetical protein